jgi:hypothetical protein
MSKNRKLTDSELITLIRGTIDHIAENPEKFKINDVHFEKSSGVIGNTEGNINYYPSGDITITIKLTVLDQKSEYFANGGL